ncbi:hypothetical protein BDR22DRAFT_806865 [Usnea florida]
MVVLYQSQTSPVNPPNASPVLTLAQVWEVMQIKARKPQLFVAPISACEVLEENESFLKRVATFTEGMGPPGGKITEDVDLRAPWKVDFRNLDSGGFISNLISQGKDETDLYLTYYFEWPYPKVEDGSEEAKKLSEQLWDTARKTVQHSIDVAREMKSKGELKH